jgi:acyl dehydratase
MMWFDELAGLEPFEIGRYTFTAEEIVAFARAYDPQPFHLDEAAGKASLFGGLAASGWHTAAAWMKCNVAAMETRNAERRARGEPIPYPGPSPGFEDMKWLRPVLAGDTLTFRGKLISARVTQSRPDWSIAKFAHQGINQRGELAFAFTAIVFLPVRPGAMPDRP